VVDGHGVVVVVVELAVTVTSGKSTRHSSPPSTNHMTCGSFSESSLVTAAQSQPQPPHQPQQQQQPP
jgi:hypothetical protein